jgi:hypothetical protein
MKLAFAIFYSKNVEGAAKFYAEVLKLEKAFGDRNFTAFHLGDILLGIKQANKKQRERRQ